jgi:hypothetical protein
MIDFVGTTMVVPFSNTRLVNYRSRCADWLNALGVNNRRDDQLLRVFTKYTSSKHQNSISCFEIIKARSLEHVASFHFNISNILYHSCHILYE